MGYDYNEDSRAYTNSLAAQWQDSNRDDEVFSPTSAHPWQDSVGGGTCGGDVSPLSPVSADPRVYWPGPSGPSPYAGADTTQPMSSVGDTRSHTSPQMSGYNTSSGGAGFSHTRFDMPENYGERTHRKASSPRMHADSGTAFGLDVDGAAHFLSHMTLQDSPYRDEQPRDRYVTRGALVGQGANISASYAGPGGQGNFGGGQSSNVGTSQFYPAPSGPYDAAPPSLRGPQGFSHSSAAQGPGQVDNTLETFPANGPCAYISRSRSPVMYVWHDVIRGWQQRWGTEYAWNDGPPDGRFTTSARIGVAPPDRALESVTAEILLRAEAVAIQASLKSRWGPIKEDVARQEINAWDTQRRAQLARLTVEDPGHRGWYQPLTMEDFEIVYADENTKRHDERSQPAHRRTHGRHEEDDEDEEPSSTRHRKHHHRPHGARERSERHETHRAASSGLKGVMKKFKDKLTEKDGRR